MHLPHPLASAARARPEHPLLVAEDGVFAAQALAQAAAALAGGLAHAGLQPGDRVALREPPSARLVLRLHALGWLGAVAVPLDPRAPEAALTGAAVRAGVRAVWGAPLPGLPGLEVEESAPLPERAWPLEEPRLVVFSSGSSGQPTPTVLHTHQLVFSAFASALRLGHDPADRWLCCLPLHHIGGLSVLVRTAIYGTTALLRPGFDAAEVAAALDSGGVQLVSLVPTMLAAVLDHRPQRPFPAALRAILLGGAPCPPALLDRARALGAPLALTWGMTETASQVATRWPGDCTPEPHTGPPLAFARVQPDPEGRLWVEGPLTATGQHPSGDRGALDGLGRVVVSGRADRVIVSGGEKIDPAQVEAILAQHPAVQEVRVQARPDPRWGQRPVARVVLRPGQPSPGLEALQEAVRAVLPRYWAPDALEVVAELPRSALGKPIDG